MFGEYTKDTTLMYIAGKETTDEYLEGPKVRKTSPKVKLLVNPYIPPFVPLEFLSTDMGGLIETYEWYKSRNQSHGTFSVVMQADDAAGTAGIKWGAGTPLSDLWKGLGVSLEDILKPPILAQLWINGYHVMTGRLVVRRKMTVRTGSGYSKKYQLQFEELGALYEEQILKSFFNFVSEDFFVVNNPNKAMDAGATSIGFQPLSFSLSLYCYAFIASTLNYGLKAFPTPYLSGSDLLPLAFRMIALPAPLGGISNMSLVSTLVTDTAMFQIAGGSSFWSFLKSMVPEPFMELYTESGGRTICTGKLIPAPAAGDSVLVSSALDLVTNTATVFPVPGLNATPMLPGFNYLICRTSPYDNPLIGLTMWHPVLAPFTLGVFDLITAGDFIIITDDDLVSKDIGVSSKQQYSVFHASMWGKNASTGSGGGDVSRPSIASGPLLPTFPGGIRSYGNKLFEGTIDSTSLSWSGLIGQTLQRWTRKFQPGTNIYSISSLLNYWFRNAAKFREGTIVTREFPYARPGMSLLYLPTRSGHVDDKRDIGVYYIDNVVNSGSIGAGGTTSFTVIRGTPIPYVLSNLMTLLLDWEIIPTGLNLFDTEYP